MSESWKIDAQLSTGGINVLLMSHAAMGPLQRVHRMEDPTVSLFLTPDYGQAQGRYICDSQPTAFGRFGALSITPAEIPLSVRSTGAPLRRLVSCRFDRGRFERLTGLGRSWDNKDLAACLDVHAKRISTSLKILAEETAVPGFAAELIVEGLGMALIAEIGRYLRGVHDRPRLQGGLAPWQMKRIVESVDALAVPLSLSDFANMCGIGKRHLMRAFRQSTGMSIMDYVTQTRLKRAAKLLSEDRLSIAEIAANLGFGSQSGFTHAFRRLAGETPSSYRKKTWPS
jgi:AraC family transcriptional regulator